MPSFDLVSKMDKMELQNAVNTAEKIFSGRFDFKGSQAKIEILKDNIEIKAEDETKVKAVMDILQNQMGKRGIGLKGLEKSEITPTGMKMMKQTIALKNGIDKENAKKIQKLIKDSGLKVNASYMDEKMRVEAKQIDDLQSFFQMLKNSKDILLDFSMENLKR
jgi:uncharacterized protein YajQ (UPF0234 family)